MSDHTFAHARCVPTVATEDCCVFAEMRDCSYMHAAVHLLQTPLECDSPCGHRFCHESMPLCHQLPEQLFAGCVSIWTRSMTTVQARPGLAAIQYYSTSGIRLSIQLSFGSKHPTNMAVAGITFTVNHPIRHSTKPTDEFHRECPPCRAQPAYECPGKTIFSAGFQTPVINRSIALLAWTLPQVLMQRCLCTMFH